MTIVDVIYQTREYFIGISKHQDESQVLEYLILFWIANENTASNVWYIFLIKTKAEE